MTKHSIYFDSLCSIKKSFEDASLIAINSVKKITNKDKDEYLAIKRRLILIEMQSFNEEIKKVLEDENWLKKENSFLQVMLKADEKLKKKEAKDKRKITPIEKI